MDGPAHVHLNGVVDVVLLVPRGAGGLGILALGRDPFDRAVQLRSQREPDVMGEEDRHLAQFLPGQLLVLQDGVDLHLHQLFLAECGQHSEQHHPPVTHRKARPGPDGAEEVIDSQREELAWHIRHLPGVDLVHLLEALAAQFVHGHSFVVGTVCGTPRPAARFFSATSATGSSTSIASPSANARLRSFSPSPRVWVKASYSQWSGVSSFMSSRTMIAPGPPVSASVCRTTRP